MHESNENLKLLPLRKSILFFFFLPTTTLLEMISGSDISISDLFYPKINSVLLTESKCI